MPLPVGLVTDPSRKVVLDPARRRATRHQATSSPPSPAPARRALSCKPFNARRSGVPAPIGSVPHKGELAWMPLKHWRVLRTLHNPRYAGAFAYGRRRERKGPDGKTFHETAAAGAVDGSDPRRPSRLHHRGHLPSTTRPLLIANAPGVRPRTRRRSRPRRPGLAARSRHLRTLRTTYDECDITNVAASPCPSYQCVRRRIQTGAPRCQSVPGGGIDTAIGQLLLDTVTPLALEVALHGTGRTRSPRRRRRRPAAPATSNGPPHHAELARRRYLSVDPDNRLIADRLEADWNDALRAPQQNPGRIAASRLREPPSPNSSESSYPQARRRLPALWADPATPERERKRVARLLIEDVTIPRTDQIHLHV